MNRDIPEPNDRERDLAQDLGDTGRVADIAQLLARYREELLSDADIVTQDAVNHAKAAREGDLRRFFKVLNLEPGECEPALAIEEHILHPRVSIGFAVYPRDGRTPAQLIRSADACMYRVKQTRHRAA